MTCACSKAKWPAAKGAGRRAAICARMPAVERQGAAAGAAVGPGWAGPALAWLGGTISSCRPWKKATGEVKPSSACSGDRSVYVALACEQRVEGEAGGLEQRRAPVWRAAAVCGSPAGSLKRSHTRTSG